MRTPLLAFLLSTTAAPSGAAELYAAGTTIFRADLSTGDVLAEHVLDSQATDIAVDPKGRYVAATTSSGLTLLEPITLTPLAHAPLGVLDAVETTLTGDSLLVLLHPGHDRRRPTGAHLVLVMPHDDLSASRSVASLGSDSYDMVASTDGRRVLVTRLVGRTLDVIDLGTGAVETIRITDERERASLAVLRAVAFMGDGAHALVGESARGRPLTLWVLDLTTGTSTAHETSWTMHASDVLVAGKHIVVNGRDQLARFDAETGVPIDRRDLTLDAWHAVASPGGGVYLAAPMETGARVLRLPPDGGEVTEVLALPARVVRLALSPSAATPTASTP